VMESPTATPVRLSPRSRARYRIYVSKILVIPMRLGSVFIPVLPSGSITP
jgi:hypothetical protein